MKIYISNYRNHWLSPYTILEKIYFWREIEYDEPFIKKTANILNPFCTALHKFLDIIHPEIKYVKIDPWDTWSMDSTLAYIILPMLKQLKETQHGAGYVYDDDVPEELKSTSAPPREDEWATDDNHFKRWEWVLDEMIFAFTCNIDDSWEDEFRSGKIDMVFVPIDKDGNEVPKEESKFSEMRNGPNHTYKCDYDGMKKVQERIDNGYRLFGKYYRNLWD
jgi:hypothetical protein